MPAAYHESVYKSSRRLVNNDSAHVWASLSQRLQPLILGSSQLAHNKRLLPMMLLRVYSFALLRNKKIKLGCHNIAAHGPGSAR